MSRLYFFRHIMMGKVLVSPEFRCSHSILNQIGVHRPQAKIRPDHWVPFLVVTGFESPETVASLQAAIAPPKAYFGPKPRWPPKESNKFPGWTIPDMVRERTTQLCRQLLTSPLVHAEFYGSEAGQVAGIQVSGASPSLSSAAYPLSMASSVASTAPLQPGIAPAADATTTPSPQASTVGDALLRGDAPRRRLRMYWERDEFRFVVDAEGLEWPEFIDHERLPLVRGRYPRLEEDQHAMGHARETPALGLAASAAA